MHNAVRVILKHQGLDVWSGGLADFMVTEGNEADAYVVKEHRWVESDNEDEPDICLWLAEYADMIFTSRRPLKEAWLSKRRFEALRNGHGENTEVDIDFKETRKWVYWLSRWKEHPNHVYCMRYMWLAQEGGPYRVIKDIAHHLGADVNPKHVLAHLRSEMAPPKGRAKDPDTLVFREHYTSVEYEEIKQTMRVPEEAKDEE